eukprot:3927584-Amphidinium_carterae.1
MKSPCKTSHRSLGNVISDCDLENCKLKILIAGSVLDLDWAQKSPRKCKKLPRTYFKINLKSLKKDASSSGRCSLHTAWALGARYLVPTL